MTRFEPAEVDPCEASESLIGVAVAYAAMVLVPLYLIAHLVAALFA